MDESPENIEPSEEKEPDPADVPDPEDLAEPAEDPSEPEEPADPLEPGDNSAEMEPDSLTDADENPTDIGFILNLPLDLTVEYGRTREKISKLLELQKGTVIELSKLKGEPVDILANDKLIAKGEVVVEDDKYAIRITEIISRSERIKKL